MSKKEKRNGESPQHITFHYLKSSQYRVVHVDGAIGGPTPAGLMHVSMFSERPAIPREQSIIVNEDGTLGDVAQIVARDGVVREMEFDAIMSLDAAKNLRDWLTRNIKTLEKHTAHKG